MDESFTTRDIIELYREGVTVEGYKYLSREEIRRTSISQLIKMVKNGEITVVIPHDDSFEELYGIPPEDAPWNIDDKKDQ